MKTAPHQEEHGRHRGRVAWLGLAAFVSVGVAVAVSLTAISLSRSAAIRSRYEKVEVGMTREQVEGILGEEGGDPASQAGHLGGLLAYGSWNSWTVFWYFDEYAISVEFYDGVVREKSIRRAPRTLLDRLKALWPF
jgi:hypothetical protein